MALRCIMPVYYAYYQELIISLNTINSCYYYAGMCIYDVA